MGVNADQSAVSFGEQDSLILVISAIVLGLPGNRAAALGAQWARQGSNLRPTDYESAALTT